jgi:UDP-N-acetylglucosamine:LPS N-acetylglucosamine transferase
MKILAIASKGGHWVQLLRLSPAFQKQQVIYVSTNAGLKETVKDFQFYCVKDGNRGSVLKLLQALFQMFKIVFTTKPEVIVTTGSAPGLMGIIAGKCMGSKTIWIDSIANVDKISTSGRIASFFADKIYTQWPHLATSRILFKGDIL